MPPPLGGEDNVIKVSLEEAQSKLGHLFDQAAAGRDVVIARADGSTARLVFLSKESTGPQKSRAKRKVGHGLDRFIGTWSAEQEAELLQAVEVFERVDESFWK
jgi:antitoxin (DNA-binding transcriptional repressor) of toxin-antitoxin stability system